MADRRITWTSKSRSEYEVFSMPFDSLNEMSLDLSFKGDETRPREMACSNLTVEAATQLRDLLDANLKVLADAYKPLFSRSEADRLAHVVAEALESASPNGLVMGEYERALIAEALRRA